MRAPYVKRYALWEKFRMRKFFITILLTLPFTFIQYATAQDSIITLDGESFTSKFVGTPPNGDKMLEFVRESETFDNWTKLVGFRYQQLPGAGNDPSKVAIGMSILLKAKGNPSAVTENKKNSEAMIDFITGPKNGFMEFNVFRYAKSTDGKAVVSLQFAYRFTDTSSGNIENILKLRESWIRQAVAFDMKIVQDALAQ